MLARRINRVLWSAAILLLVFFALKTFVGDVYPVTSSSMAPTIREGERVLVCYDSSPPERFDLVVLRRAGEAFVKRAVALGGETLSIRHGDPWIDDAPLSFEEPRAPLIPLFDSSVQDVADHFKMGSTQVNPWSEVDGVWELDAKEIERDTAAGLLRLHHAVRDDWIERDASVRRGTDHVGDVALECSFQVVEACGRLRVILIEQGDTFQFSLELDGENESVATLSRRSAGDFNETEELASCTLPVAVGAWTSLSFANVDNHLRVTYGDEPRVLEVSYAQNTPHPRDTNAEGFSIGERVKLGGEECHLLFKDIRVFRDRHYTPRGTFAVTTPAPIGPDQLFVLGDNSVASQDSREWGPVDRRDVIGRAVWVVWPPSSIRRLEGAVTR